VPQFNRTPVDSRTLFFDSIPSVNVVADQNFTIIQMNEYVNDKIRWLVGTIYELVALKNAVKSQGRYCGNCGLTETIGTHASGKRELCIPWKVVGSLEPPFEEWEGHGEPKRGRRRRRDGRVCSLHASLGGQ
jgi:hypothetical protein